MFDVEEEKGPESLGTVLIEDSRRIGGATQTTRVIKAETQEGDSRFLVEVVVDPRTSVGPEDDSWLREPVEELLARGKEYQEFITNTRGETTQYITNITPDAQKLGFTDPEELKKRVSESGGDLLKHLRNETGLPLGRTVEPQATEGYDPNIDEVK